MTSPGRLLSGRKRVAVKLAKSVLDTFITSLTKLRDIPTVTKKDNYVVFNVSKLTEGRSTDYLVVPRSATVVNEGHINTRSLLWVHKEGREIKWKRMYLNWLTTKIANGSTPLDALEYAFQHYGSDRRGHLIYFKDPTRFLEYLEIPGLMHRLYTTPAYSYAHEENFLDGRTPRGVKLPQS